METGNSSTNVNSSTKGTANSSSSQELVAAYEAIGSIHLVVVVIPTLVMAPVVLYHLYKLMKTSGVKPVSLLFFCLALWCMAGPLSYGILWDVSLIGGYHVFGFCTSVQPTYVIQYVLQFGIGMALSATVAMIAVLQLMVLKCRDSVKMGRVITAYVGLVVLSFGVSFIFFNGGYTEIRGSHCKASLLSGLINVVVWAVLAYALPILVTVICSVLTCLKVKKDVADEDRSVVRSVVVLNTFNIFLYVVTKIGSLMVYFIVVSISPTATTIFLWTTIARYVGELSYVFSVFSILVFHTSIRKAAFRSCMPRTRRTGLDDLKRSTELTLCNSIEQSKTS